MKRWWEEGERGGFGQSRWEVRVEWSWSDVRHVSVVHATVRDLRPGYTHGSRPIGMKCRTVTRVAVKDVHLPSKSMAPLWSTSTSLIMSCSSESEGFWPSERMMSPSSLAVMVPFGRARAKLGQ